MTYHPFHGSYHPDDVDILLKPITIDYTSVATKEALIQSGQKHYSEMLSAEYQPSPAYLQIFYAACARNQARLARHAWALAAQLAAQPRLPVLVSLARAGTPVGVLLKRILRDFLGLKVAHYSISIIRDRGIDQQALRHILCRHDALGRDIVFIDGWTGKGVIAGELRRSAAVFNALAHAQISTELWVLADISGMACVAATHEDYLIPSALLNATIGGLISRSILLSNDTDDTPPDFHACKFHEEWLPQDLSCWYIDQLMTEVARLAAQREAPAACVSPAARDSLQAQSQAFLAQVMAEYAITDLNFIKPGLGEAIRVLLRRLPHRMLVRDPAHSDVAPLLVLAKEKNIPVLTRPEMPYQAVGIIAHVAT